MISVAVHAGARARTAPAVLVIALLAACSNGGGSEPGLGVSRGGDFVLLGTEPATNGQVFLNDSIALDFSNVVDLSSADLNTVSFQVFDSNGVSLSESPRGTFSIGTSPADEVPGRRLIFSPRFPDNDEFDDGGFRPGRLYRVQLPAGGDVTSLRDASSRQRKLAGAASFEFSTVDGNAPSELFRDTRFGGPRRTGFAVSGLANGLASLNLLGHASVEVRLEFDQPLNPSSLNVPRGLDPDPTRRGADRGRIYLEFDDDTRSNVWIPATVTIERNALDGSTVVLRPVGVLPNDATIRVIVTKDLEDLTGQSNASDTRYDPEFARFETVATRTPIYDAIVERFTSTVNTTVDFDAPLLEPQAELEGGALASTFDFDGRESILDYRPTSRSTILDTNFTQVAPVGSLPINVSGGVFRFRNVTIPVGSTIRGVGPNPLVWQLSGNMRIDGTLTVEGGAGAFVDTLRSANFPTAGGIGVCGGGNGGAGSPNGSGRSAAGEAGFGPRQRAAQGGSPGELTCSGCPTGAGGGSFATEGDPEFALVTPSASWDHWTGTGGSSCGAPGGDPGPMAFVDARDDNNFWGVGVNVSAGLRVRGELFEPIGGSGGGGGGDQGGSCDLGDPTWIIDTKGGGGGAGGGVLIVQTLGRIEIGPSGRVSADGGNGGGGEASGSSIEGGGGGGGSGGMVILMAAGGIHIDAHGGAYADGDTDFAISADGGIGAQGTYSPFPSPAQPLLSNYSYVVGNTSGRGTGGFGGMGVIQLMTPPGDDVDETGSFLDDGVRFYDASGDEIVGDAKKALLGWRGWPGESGQRVDDFGDPVTTSADGDMRPAPVLLPARFGPRSRARSRWIDLGFVARRLGSNGPNSVSAAAEPVPDYEFGGVRTDGDDAGYVDWQSRRPSAPLVVDPVAVVSIDTTATFRGAAAYRVRVSSTALAELPEHRYAHYRAELLADTGAPLVDARILGHTAAGTREVDVYLEPSTALPSAATGLQIRAKFFELTTDGQVGFGELIDEAPAANVRIGFAFHVDPTLGDNHPQRYPRTGYSADVAGLVDEMRAAGDRPSFVQWDVLFDHEFRAEPGGLEPRMPVMTLEYLVLPFRF